MFKKSAAGLLGTLIAAGIAAGIAKYLKDYSNASFTDEEQINKVKKNSGEVKEAAKRTYVAIKEKGNVKEAAEELAKAAGSVVSDSASIAKTAGAGAVQAAKDIKAKFDEDPEAAKEEMISNLKDMGAEISQKVTATAEDVVGRFRGEDEFTDFEDSDFDDVIREAASDGSEDAAVSGEAVASASECPCQTAEDVLEEVKKTAAGTAESVKEAAADAAETAENIAEEAAEAVEDAAEAAGDAVESAAEAAAEKIEEAKTYVADKAEEEAIETANILDELKAGTEETIAEAAEEADKVLNAAPSATITDDELD